MITRFSVSVENDLLEKFEEYIHQEGYPTRSEAVKALIRNALIKKDWHGDTSVAATVTLIYDHHKSNLVNKLLEIQHDFGAGIVTSQHVHLDHDNCMEVLIVRGLADEIAALTKRLKSVKGIKHCGMIMSSSGGDI